MSTPARTIDAVPYLDFRNYAPAPRPLAVRTEPKVETDELALAWRTLCTALGIVRKAAGIAVAIMAWRARVWCHDNILRSLSASWSLAGLGWGGFVGISLIQFFTR